MVYRSLGHARTSAQGERGQWCELVRPAQSECVGVQCWEAGKRELTADIPGSHCVSRAEPMVKSEVLDVRIDRNASGQQVLREGVVPFGRRQRIEPVGKPWVRGVPLGQYASRCQPRCEVEFRWR